MLAPEPSCDGVITSGMSPVGFWATSGNARSISPMIATVATKTKDVPCRKIAVPRGVWIGDSGFRNGRPRVASVAFVFGHGGSILGPPTPGAIGRPPAAPPVGRALADN